MDVLNQLVLQNLREMISFARLYEDEFVKIVVDEHYRQVQLQQRRNQLEYQAALSRDKRAGSAVRKNCTRKKSWEI